MLKEAVRVPLDETEKNSIWCWILHINRSEDLRIILTEKKIQWKAVKIERLEVHCKVIIGKGHFETLDYLITPLSAPDRVSVVPLIHDTSLTRLNLSFSFWGRFLYWVEKIFHIWYFEVLWSKELWISNPKRWKNLNLSPKWTTGFKIWQ